MAVTLNCEDMCITNISIVNPSFINCTYCRHITKSREKFTHIKSLIFP